MADSFASEFNTGGGGFQRAKVETATLTAGGTVDNDDLVAAVAGKKIGVLHVWLQPDTGTAVFHLRSDTTELTGELEASVTVAYQTPVSPVPLIQTAAGEALNLLLTGGTGSVVHGHITYMLID